MNLACAGKSGEQRDDALSYSPSFSFSNLPPRRGLLSATTSPHSPTPQPQQRSAHIFFITRNYSDSAAAAAAVRALARSLAIYFARRRRRQSYFVIRVSCCDPRGYRRWRRRRRRKRGRRRRRRRRRRKEGGTREGGKEGASVPSSGLALESRCVAAAVAVVVPSERS